MDIKEALEQVKETSANYMVAIEGLIKFIGDSQAEVEEMVNTKAELEKSISDLQSEMSANKEVHLEQEKSIAETIENAKKNQKESIRALREQSNKEMGEIEAERNQKMEQLNVKINELNSTAKNLERDILEKQSFLEELNKSIEAIKSKLNR